MVCSMNIVLPLHRRHQEPPLVKVADCRGSPTSSFLNISNFFSFSTLLSCSRTSKEKGHDSTWLFSGSRGWKGRPKWGAGWALSGDGGFTWRGSRAGGGQILHQQTAVEQRYSNISAKRTLT